MNVTVEQLPESKVRLNIAADPAEHEEAVEKAYRKIVRDIQVPGFRKGKAPRSMIERMYGRDAFVEEANGSLMDSLYRRALESESIVPVGDPEVESIEPDPLSFVVVIPVYPTIEPGDYLSVRTDPVDASIADDQVDELIEQLRLQQSPWIDPAKPRKPRDGDQVTVDLHIMDGEDEFQPPTEDTVFIIGESNLLDELQVAIEGLAIGESTSADIPFPEDDDRYGEDDPRRGKTMTYNVTLKGIKERDLLEVDDEFAKTYGNAESLAELKERVKTNLHAERTREARNEALAAIIEAIAAGATIEVPDAMVETAIDERVERLRNQLQYRGASLEAYLRQAGRSEDALREDIRPAAATDLRNSLILQEIAKREGIEISEEEVIAEIETIASSSPEAAEMREAYLGNPYLISTLRNDLFDQRMTDRLIEIATEGRGAVTGGYEAPETADIDLDQTEDAEAAPADSEDVDQAGKESLPAPTPEGSVTGDGSPTCPGEYPIKGNADSMLYHQPGDPNYSATIAEFCFSTVEQAAAAGYSPAVKND